MDAAVWGPHAWCFIHSLTLAYPKNPTDKEKKSTIQFFTSLKDILPCDLCKTHYRNNIDDSELAEAVTTRKKLIEWAIALHNKVNIELGKRIYTKAEVIDYYKTKYTYSCVKYLPLIIVLLFVIVLLATFFTIKTVENCYCK